MRNLESLICRVFGRLRSSRIYIGLLVLVAASSIYLRALLAEARQQDVYDRADLVELFLMADLHINTLSRYFYIWIIAAAVLVLVHMLKR